MPIIEMIEPHIYAAGRLAGMGISISSRIGEMAAEMILKGNVSMSLKSKL